MTFDILPAGDAAYDTIRNLARFYIYDMAEHAGWPFEDGGTFDVGDQFNPFFGKPRPSRAWPETWTGHPFLMTVDGNPAGFALVVERRGDALLYDMGEFFVARQYRRHDIGRKGATAMFDRFRGPWQVREMMTNIAAQAFWRRIIKDYTSGAFTDGEEAVPEIGGKHQIVQRFDSSKV
jgi:predicted acetyltransferase